MGKNTEPKTDEQKSLFDFAEEAVIAENAIPFIIWDKIRDGTEFMVIIKAIENEIVIAEKKDGSQIRFSLKAKALATQFSKLKVVEEDLLLIKYMGVQSQTDGFDFKSFIVKKYIPELKKFVTSKTI